MVWGCFWGGGVGPLVTLQGNIDQDKYVSCLAENFLPWFEKLSNRTNSHFLFQEDGAPCHTGAYASWYKKEKGLIDRFDFWPAQSPDLNPIEHIWAHIALKIRKNQGVICNPKDLEAFIHKTWLDIPLDFLANLIASMPDRCRAVIANNGGSTRY